MNSQPTKKTSANIPLIRQTVALLSSHRSGMAVAGLLTALFATACAVTPGSGSEAAAGEQGAAVTRLAPITTTTGPHTQCTGVIECTASTGYPWLTVTCPKPALFDGVSIGTTYGSAVTNVLPTTPVSACYTYSGGIDVCDDFSTYMASATSTYCGAPVQPKGCNGEAKPTSRCKAGWTCCGSDGWECGVCQ